MSAEDTSDAATDECTQGILPRSSFSSLSTKTDSLQGLESLPATQNIITLCLMKSMIHYILSKIHMLAWAT
ncbi:hypothetical protein FKM82_023529 [Ascaphus truei]